MDEYKGAQWVRVDFHLHSPGSHTFNLPSGLDHNKDKEEIIERYVNQLVSQRIKIAAITDYNGIRQEWYEPIAQKAEKRGIVVLPGAELCFKAGSAGKYGLHILLVFPKDINLNLINTAISKLDSSYEPLFSENKVRPIELRGPLEEEINRLRKKFKALLIIPHPGDDDKGLFKTFKPEQAANFIRSVRPDAIENFTEIDRHKIITTGIIKKEELSRIASVEFSDPKSIEEIGTKLRSNGKLRTTYLKLSIFDSLEAIKIALHDPEVRVQISDYPEFHHTFLKSLEIQGSGFCGGIKVFFSPELNTVIGGRGVGKSAILEVIRYILNIEPYAPTEYREGLVRHALGSGGKAILYLQVAISNSISRFYRIERVWGESPRVFELDPEQEVELDPQQLFGIDNYPLFFGQREIYETARREELRLRLLDEILGPPVRNKQIEFHKYLTDLKKNARDILDLSIKLEEKENIVGKLNEIEHQISIYEKEGIAQKLQQATLLAKDEEYLAQIIESITNAYSKWSSIKDEILEELERAILYSKRAKSDHKDLIYEAGNIVQNLKDHFENIFEQNEVTLKETNEKIKNIEIQWKQKRRAIDEKINLLKQEIGSSSLDPDLLEKLIKEKTRLKNELDRLNRLERKFNELVKNRRKLLGKLQDIRYEIFKLRQEKAEELNELLKHRLRIDISYKAEKKDFLNRLKNIFSGSRLDSKTIERITHKEGIDGIQLARIIRKGEDSLTNNFGITPTRAKQIIMWFEQNPEKLLELELLFPEDEVRIFLNLDHSELPLEKLSDGQKATALLLLILSLKNRLLIVDQPEDDLDNRFIFDDIVPILRSQKGMRQIIVATHNPNIPVLGDAELILVLEAQEERALIAHEGSIDKKQIRNMVKKIMEGGDEAFRRRAEKYGFPEEL